jgi:flagellar biosynthetic protein FliR
MAAQLTASLLFFASGADREVLRVFGRSLEVMPPGAYVLDGAWLQVVIRLGGVMVETAVRLALPVVALLICVDVMLALIGRVNAHLQLLALALPLKMLIALVMLAALVSAMPSIFRSGADRTFATLGALVQKQ